MKKKQNEGFTLIELLVVIGIIGVLASIIMTNLQQAREQAANAERLQTKQSVITALNLFQVDDKNWPIIGGNDWICIGPSSLTCWLGTRTGSDTVWAQFSPYFTGVPVQNADPNTFAYQAFLYGYPKTFNSATGAYFVWAKSTPITTGECPPPSFISAQIGPYWYCYYYLGP